ncbi:hypothetical protein GO013_08885 [Pseudodesulfovibrio sp. JC047]|uniref:hypothetical protein n=1 Tax=Pseudodesulfovibrio sp. JC047 TaxID=2683199 RepID=UPI0013D3C35F|nr:hypothetical protein [Pseudodesulfovibrio sp. JC047]NDV19532.1 hypothetical protein [Pseudodesulfovibrio sp. JC047]
MAKPNYKFAKRQKELAKKKKKEEKRQRKLAKAQGLGQSTEYDETDEAVDSDSDNAVTGEVEADKDTAS